MKNTSSIITIIIVVAIVLVSGGIIYNLTQPDDSSDQPVGTESSTSNNDNESTDTETPPPATPDDTADGSQVIDGVTIPASVLVDIERDYPDYVIDDADRETRDGQVYYEIDLEHRDPGNDTDYELTYDADWSLIKTERD